MTHRAGRCAVAALASIDMTTCDRSGKTRPKSGGMAPMRIFSSRMFRCVLLGTALAVSSVLGALRPAGAVEVGEAAPDFKLASTTGGDISLSDFRGKKWVLLEFYGADFTPT